jgi:hypothetical protein
MDSARKELWLGQRLDLQIPATIVEIVIAVLLQEVKLVVEVVKLVVEVVKLVVEVVKLVVEVER